jgi:pyruvate,orthophosphate dikinase
MVDGSKWVYMFSEGDKDMKELLGGKGANLCEMTKLGIPVPPGFIITTEACKFFYRNGNEFPPGMIDQVKKAVKSLERTMGARFGEGSDPLLFSVRSGARASMPGMMDTILNLGLNDAIVEGLIKKSGNERFARDSYRRFIQMYGDVVMGLKPVSKDEVDPFERIMDEVKEKRGKKNDLDLGADDLKELAGLYISEIKSKLGTDFPYDPYEQLWGAIKAVFSSWMNDRAIKYRKLNNIPDDWGTAVNVQCMVFGNMGEDSATGVAFTRDPSTGERIFYGEYLTNAQGEDVVAGIRTPLQVTTVGSRRWAKDNGIKEERRAIENMSLEERMPSIYSELVKVYERLESHYREMQDIEFTIQDGKLWLLQTRNGKRTAAAAVKIAVDMVEEGLIDRNTALLRVLPDQLDQLLHPTFDPTYKKNIIARGLPASPGAATGRVVFNAEDAEEWADKGESVILVRIETSPEDIGGMQSAKGILTTRGGMTSHAAVVARGMGKCCVSGCGSLKVSYQERNVKVNDIILREGDWISLDGTTGEVILGKVPAREASIGGDFGLIMEWADECKRLGVRTNADTPKDAKTARSFGAEGIGLCRTEHMFFEGERIKAMREMILADDESGRRKALKKLLPMQREDFIEIFRVMSPYPVTIRLLDPPLHEFLPHEEEAQKEMAAELGKTFEEVKARVESLKEFNPMLGHRGCRLAITYPEITEMQTRAIIEAAVTVADEGLEIHPEIMVPLVGIEKEFSIQKDLINKVANEVMTEKGKVISYKVGTMIEIPRAAIVADRIAKIAEFFSFGTNDLTQMTFGYSRDDSASFLDDYIKNGILTSDPFKKIDRDGVGALVRMGIERGRQGNPRLKVGICGEHGGEPDSVEFFHQAGLDYVSCSPYRVPIARLAAAHAAIKGSK